MAVLDSNVYFQECALAMCLAQEQVVAVVYAGWSTMGEFAFASVAPGSANDQLFVRDVVRTILSGGSTCDDRQDA